MATVSRRTGQNGWKILGSNGMGRAPTMMRNSRSAVLEHDINEANAIKQERQKRRERSNLWRHDGGGVLAGEELVELLNIWIAKDLRRG